jgi:hypothetical protein
LEKLDFFSKCTFHRLQNDTVKECRQSAKFVSRCNIVVRDVRDRNGNKVGTVVEPYDATEADVIAAAQRATDRMYEEYPEASNTQSRIGATDATGRPKWSISPNFKHIAEIGTDEASYIWGNMRPQCTLKG